jgi:4-hydroxybenzoyl-CoA thioesterase
MARTVVYPVEIQFGDCDPAGIVFFPNFSRWMDAASLHFFVSCGVLPWRELVKTTGIIGTPLLAIEIHTSVEEWRAKVFIQRHVVKRGEDLICEGTETRIFTKRDANDPARIYGIPIPPDIRALCE